MEQDISEDKIPRKWEYIADQLRILNAPKKVINAAVEIDNAMIELGLDFNTDEWESWFIEHRSRTLPITELYYGIKSEYSCSACYDAGEGCSHCKLGDSSHCTPRSKYADNYYRIVVMWAGSKRRDELRKEEE